VPATAVEPSPQERGEAVGRDIGEKAGIRGWRSLGFAQVLYSKNTNED
jgi:hypothetical protein